GAAAHGVPVAERSSTSPARGRGSGQWLSAVRSARSHQPQRSLPSEGNFPCGRLIPPITIRSVRRRRLKHAPQKVWVSSTNSAQHTTQRLSKKRWRILLLRALL